MSSRWILILSFAVLGAWAAVPSALADGTQTGVLAGTVRDPQGELLQGVEVRLEGPQGKRSAVTDDQGRFRFPALGVGVYSVAAELLGLNASEPEVAVYVERTSEVVLRLSEDGLSEDGGDVSEAEVEEWIQVIAEAPVIDRFETRVGANVRLEFLEELPVERFYQSVALLLPGVSGGSDGNPETSGALRSSNLFLIDGVDTTDPTTGLFGLNLSYEAIQEVQVTTAAPPAEYGRSSGAVINVVTRSGSNEYRGVARWVATNNDWNGDVDRADPALAHLGREIEAANAGADRLDSTVALSLGGPLWRERLWFFLAHEDSERSSLRPTLLSNPWDVDTEVASSAFKVTWQPTPEHTLVVQHTSDDAVFGAFEPFARSPSELTLPETPAMVVDEGIVNPLPGDLFAIERIEQVGRFTKLQWNATFGQNVSLALNLAEQEREIDRGRRNSRGLTADAPHVAVVPDPRDPGERFELFLFNGVTEVGFEDRPRRQGNVALDAYLNTGRIEHEFKIGIDYQETDSESKLAVAGAPGVDRATGRPVEGQLYIDFDPSPECLLLGMCRPFNPVTGAFQPAGLFNFWQRPVGATREENLAVYLSDTLIFEHWLLSVGLRYESVRVDDADRRLAEDDDLAPRLGLTWDPLGDGRQVLSLSWGRYYETFLQQYPDAFRRVDPLSGFTEYERLGRVAGVDCGQADPADLSSPCWQPVNAEPFVPILIGAPNEGLDRSLVEELVAGFERQLTPSIGLSLHFVDRSWDDLWDGVQTIVPDGQGGGQLFTTVQNLSEAERRYRAVQVLLQKRFANRWQLLASYTWSEAEGNLFSNDGLDTFADFREFLDTNVVNRFGPAPYDRPHQLGVFANYQIPWDRLHLSLGSALRYRDGVPFERQQREDAGIRFLTPRGSERLTGVFQWDLAATLGFRLASELELELKTEIFNLTDEQEPLGAESLVASGIFGRPRSLEQVQRPRMFRFTLGLRF